MKRNDKVCFPLFQNFKKIQALIKIQLPTKNRCLQNKGADKIQTLAKKGTNKIQVSAKYSRQDNIWADKVQTPKKYRPQQNIGAEKIQAPTKYRRRQNVCGDKISYCFGLAKSTFAGYCLTLQNKNKQARFCFGIK